MAAVEDALALNPPKSHLFYTGKRSVYESIFSILRNVLHAGSVLEEVLVLSHRSSHPFHTKMMRSFSNLTRENISMIALLELLDFRLVFERKLGCAAQCMCAVHLPRWPKGRGTRPRRFLQPPTRNRVNIRQARSLHIRYWADKNRYYT